MYISGATMPFTVAAMPASATGSGRLVACCVAIASCDPNRLMSSPGA
jgi:hypothetical protein